MSLKRTINVSEICQCWYSIILAILGLKLHTTHLNSYAMPGNKVYSLILKEPKNYLLHWSCILHTWALLLYSVIKCLLLKYLNNSKQLFVLKLHTSHLNKAHSFKIQWYQKNPKSILICLEVAYFTPKLYCYAQL